MGTPQKRTLGRREGHAGLVVTAVVGSGGRAREVFGIEDGIRSALVE